ncbi:MULTISPECIES: Cof-type HAD-IIB family hydrolase [unclassified Clostridium]|uniref:Cof-type HAD-IIB family hydrolase n=1 Tax=unclassified Clostridium TaxID=2614128 RepID=UPI000297D102|nr:MULTISPECIES: Cof-type HAD-IIB family hydrolase [unclassified Clostridium]EKQ55012.1 MAG: HAD-superfamily hydrolase, subfamily IIB [Clostridium sp. Maddingley MBC34-26]
MNNFKMVCLDIDGTLLNSKHEITEKVKSTINIVANENKVPVILVSARMPKGIKFLQKELGIEEPIICYSGALILGKDNTILAKEFIDISNLEDIYKLANKNNIHMSLYKDDEWYVEQLDYWAKQESEITNITPNITNFSELIEQWRIEGTGPNKILCMSAPEEINFLKENIKVSDLNIYPSKPTYLEIMPIKASKTAAINCLQRKLNIDKSEIIAMGDNYNDIDMLEYAGLGIAMGNAPEEVKGHANDVALTNDEDGVAEALLKYVI